MQVRAAAGTQARADACIIIFLDGGPSHLDMWDMKPEAPDGIRGEFQPIATSLLGRAVLGAFAASGDANASCMTLIRSMHHTVNNAPCGRRLYGS